MSNTIRIKRRSGAGSAGAPSTLENAELAFNEADDILYYGKGTGGAGGSATTIESIGGPGAYVTLGTTQTITGAKTFSSGLTTDITGNADTATALETARDITLTGDVTGTDSFDGSANASLSTTLANSGVTAGTYTKITVDAKGRATVGDTLDAADVPTLTASKISDFDTQVQTSRLDEMAAPTASVDLNSQKITGLADPTAADDAATKSYVDSTAEGLDVKESVRVATTADITLSGTQTIDGISVIAGDRVLVKNQTTTSENGIYEVDASTWSRAADFDDDDEVTSGAFTFVEEGTANADTGWVLSTANPITVGTTGLSFVQFSGAGTGVTAGDGLTKTGNTLDVGAGTGITVDSTSVSLDTTNDRNVDHSGVTLTAGDGITGGGDITASRTFTLGTPDTLTDATTNAVTATSHTHAVTFPVTSVNTETGAVVLDNTDIGLGNVTNDAQLKIASNLSDLANAGTARTNLGLGTIATQDASSVNITGGTVDSITLTNTVINGGTF